MLEPRDRQLLFEALKPPVGYRFDQGIGTTYSMDLLAMLLAPVAFTYFDQHAREDGPAHASLEVLEGLRRYADRLTIFCEAGRIAVPRGRYPQLAFVESSVIQCRPPEGGSFHPKLWVLRYDGDGPVRYRVLCLTRNLMFCRAWDTMLTLDGELKNRTVAVNRPLADFVEALPGFADTPSDSVRNRATQFAKELLTTEFERPADVEEVKFWPFGLPSRRTNPFRELGKRLLIVSPFVGLTALEKLAAQSSECVVVSTVPQLAALSRRPEGISKFFVLNERAVAECDETSAAVSESMADAIAQGDLHAKLYVTENGATAHVWTGSLNATDAALNRNVEFMVELVGHRKKFGIDAMMVAEKGEVRLVNLIRDVTDADIVAKDKPDQAIENLEQRLDAVRIRLVDARLEAAATAREDGAYGVELRSRGDGVAIDEDLDATCWPVSAEFTKTAIRACESGGRLVEFAQLSTESLTTFFAFEIIGRASGAERQLRFVLNVPLTGGPADRRERVLRSFLSDRGRFLRFLMLLLADEGFDPDAMGEALDDEDKSSDEGTHAGVSGLLEMMLHALDAAPTRLDHLHSLLQQVTADAEGRNLLPPGFDDVWQPIWAHREELRRRFEVSV